MLILMYVEPLGRQFIPLLMEVVTGEVAGGPLTTRFITRARREAAKVTSPSSLPPFFPRTLLLLSSPHPHSPIPSSILYCSYCHQALWNFAYLESNRALISGDDGIAKLNKTLEKSDDVILKKNVAGILHMFTSPATVVPQERCDKRNPQPLSYPLHILYQSSTYPLYYLPIFLLFSPSLLLSSPNPLHPPPSFSPSSSSPPSPSPFHYSSRGQHVMLSYNWGNQSIVKRIASSLEEKGYEVWLDIERMNGSTLEASIFKRRREKREEERRGEEEKKGKEGLLSSTTCDSQASSLLPSFCVRLYTSLSPCSLSLSSLSSFFL